MKHETLLGFAFESFQALHVVAGSQCCGNKRLSFSTGEDGGTVRARQHSNFDRDASNLIKRTPIRTAFLMSYSFAEDPFTQSFIIGLQLCARILIVLGNLSFEFLLELPYQGVTFGLGMFLCIEAIGQICADLLFQLVVISLVELRRRNFPLGLAGF